MKPCDRALVEILDRDSDILEKDGVSIHLKNIPDETRKGVYDPREFLIRKAVYDFQKYLPQSADLAVIRQNTRSYTLNLNETVIPRDCFHLAVEEKEIPVFVYDGNRKQENKVPAFIYIHGGSFLAGKAEYYHDICAYIAEKAQCVAFNIDYSLAPEHPFPEAVCECTELLTYIHENAGKFRVDPAKVTIGGDSAGANLAIAAFQKSPEEAKPCALSLFYPCVDLWAGDGLYVWDEKDYEIDEGERELILSRLSLGRSDGKGDNDLMLSIFRSYMGQDYDKLKRNPYASPIYADLSGFPPTQIFTAEFDALRIQAEYFAKKLKENGVKCSIFRYRGVSHAFLDYFGVLPQAESAVREVVRQIKSGSIEV